MPRSNDYRAQAFDTLFDKENAVESIAVFQSRIAFKDQINGYVYYSPVISKERITIMFKLDIQKNTYIYVDRNNQENYYFDLEFF